MSEQGLISIAMSTYNGERFIKEQIDSILEQSYSNLELIITDDGSSDKTIDIIKDYQKKDIRIKLYQNETNLGFVQNFAKAISLCGGEYIALADQDDIWKKDKLKTFLKKIGGNVLIYSDADLVDEHAASMGKELIRPARELVSGANNRAFLLENCVSGNTLMFKKELLPYILPIPQSASFHDRWIVFVATTYGSIIYTEKPMTYYRRYSEQITKKREKDYEGFFDRLKKKKEFKVKSAKVAVKDLRTFLSLKILKNEETKEIIEMLIEHYENYEQLVFNKPLYKLLKKHKDDIFAMSKKDKRDKKAMRTAMGLKLHTRTLFVL
jgi:glycosyltransferase involved in cell wall biosynthesis